MIAPNAPSIQNIIASRTLGTSGRLIAQFGSTPPPVESIQDVVEAVLIDNGHARTAKEYILYRAERTKNRDMNMRLMKTMT